MSSAICQMKESLGLVPIGHDLVIAMCAYYLYCPFGYRIGTSIIKDVNKSFDFSRQAFNWHLYVDPVFQ